MTPNALTDNSQPGLRQRFNLDEEYSRVPRLPPDFFEV